MNDLIVNEICLRKLHKYPDKIKRFEIGHGNYVYKISFSKDKFVIRINTGEDVYKDTIYWLDKLMVLGIPVPRVISSGSYNGLSYLILNYIPGKDLGIVYGDLSDSQKQLIAKEIVNIQNKVATLPKNLGYGYLSSYEDKGYKNTWKEVILEHLQRSRTRIQENKIFDSRKVDQVEQLLERYDNYFSSIEPIPFLDDLSSKNVLVYEGNLSGIIDIDFVCFGDRLYNVGYTRMALMSLDYDTKYIDFMVYEMKLSSLEKEVLILYSLCFCVDFMGERGMKIKDKVIKVDEKEIKRLNGAYEKMYRELIGGF